MSPVSCLVSHVSCSHVPSTVPNYAKLFQTKQKQATVHAPEVLHDLVVSLFLSPQIYVFCVLNYNQSHNQWHLIEIVMPNFGSEMVTTTTSINFFSLCLCH